MLRELPRLGRSDLCLRALADVGEAIRDGDLLLYRRRGLVSAAGRGVHSHAAKAAWWEGDLYCVEICQFRGGRAVTLRSQVGRYPGRIDVFETNPDNRWPDYDRRQAVRMMRQLAGCHYGYRGLLWAAAMHFPCVRWWVRLDDENDPRQLTRPPFAARPAPWPIDWAVGWIRYRTSPTGSPSPPISPAAPSIATGSRSRPDTVSPATCRENLLRPASYFPYLRESPPHETRIRIETAIEPSTAPRPSRRPCQPRLKPCFDVIVECHDEDQQQAIFERMTAEGHRCRLLFL